MKKHIFEAIFMFIKFKIRFLKSFSCLGNEKSRFWSVFHIYKIKFTLFLAFFMFTKMKITFLKRFSCLQNEKTRFWSTFHVYKMEIMVLKRFHVYKMKKHDSEAFSSFKKWRTYFRNIFQNGNTLWGVFYVYKIKKKTHFWSVFQV